MFIAIALFFMSIRTTVAQVDVRDVIRLTNQYRTENRLQTLKVNPKLTLAAQQKVNDILTKNYWSHVSPTGVTPWNWIKNTGYKYTSAGENLAQGYENSGQVVSAWKASATHNQNLISSNFCQIGVAKATGILKGKKTTVVVQMLACPRG